MMAVSGRLRGAPGLARAREGPLSTVFSVPSQGEGVVQAGRGNEKGPGGETGALVVICDRLPEDVVDRLANPAGGGVDQQGVAADPDPFIADRRDRQAEVVPVVDPVVRPVPAPRQDVAEQ